VNQFIASGSYYSAIFKSVDQEQATSLFPYSMFSTLFTGLGGINYAFPQGRNVTQYQFVDDVSVTAGNHNLKFGGDFRRNDLTDFVYSQRSVTPLVYLTSSANFQAGNWDRYSERFPQRLARVDLRDVEVQRATLQRRELEQIGDQREQVLARRLHLIERLILLVGDITDGAPLSLRDFNMQMVNNCSRCHEKQAPSYRDTFHGQATALNFKLAATCADCHTPHKNLPPSDPHSSVNPANLMQTCGRCHTQVSANFIQYDPHPEPKDPQKSLLVYYVAGFMQWLLIGVFGFFGLHTLLWLQRSIVAVAREKHEPSPDDEQYVIRFAPFHRFTHILIVVSFLILAATGLPLMYYYTEWGQTLAGLFGGVGVTTILHRVAAVITFGYAGLHLGFVLKKAIVERKFWILYGPDSMMIRPQDFKDAFGMFRWFFYLGPRPKLDRWTYWEKFDYFAVFWGIPMIGLSGLMLWFPTFFTSFLPGVVLNLAMIIHGEEALLATAFIFAFHFYHNHLRPENFPMDLVMFTGKLSLAKFKEERPVEYARLIEEGKLDEIMTTPPTARQKLISKIFGYIAYIGGLIMVIAIFVTMLRYKL
jgi:cytochrome b subunit of formate dehydrogenase/cytochrome c553